MRASEPVAGVTPTTRPARTAALCTVAVVPFLCGVLTLLAFLQFHPAGDSVYRAFSPPARIAVLVGQIVVPSLGGPLLGVALGRWVRFPGAAFVLLLILYGWVSLVTILSMPASLVVDVTPTGPVRRTRIRAVALLAPLAAGALVMLAAALRGLALPWAPTGLALAGNVLLGFAAACVVRTRAGEPGPTAGAAVVLVLMAPSLVPQVTRWVRTFPAPGANGPSSDTLDRDVRVPQLDRYRWPTGGHR